MPGWVTLVSPTASDAREPQARGAAVQLAVVVAFGDDPRVRRQTRRVFGHGGVHLRQRRDRGRRDIAVLQALPQLAEVVVRIMETRGHGRATQVVDDLGATALQLLIEPGDEPAEDP
jgi:hypothetical protein